MGGWTPGSGVREGMGLRGSMTLDQPSPPGVKERGQEWGSGLEPCKWSWGLVMLGKSLSEPQFLCVMGSSGSCEIRT